MQFKKKTVIRDISSKLTIQILWKKCYLSHLNFSGSWDNCLNCPTSARIISSFDFKHRTAYNISFICIPFTGKHEPNKLTCSPMCDFIAQLVTALHRPQRSWVRIRLSHLNFWGSWENCLNCPASARIISSFDFKHRTAYNISFNGYSLCKMLTLA